MGHAAVNADATIDDVFQSLGGGEVITATVDIGDEESGEEEGEEGGALPLALLAPLNHVPRLPAGVGMERARDELLRRLGGVLDARGAEDEEAEGKAQVLIVDEGGVRWEGHDLLTP